MSPPPTLLDSTRHELAVHLVPFTPELVVAGTVVALLLLRLIRPLDRVNLLPAAAAGAFTAFGLTV
nr:hypothetical protein [Fimbriiglobus sp.]